MDSLEWSRSFPIFSISRLFLHSSGIPRELVKTLTDEDMEAIAERIAEYMLIEPFEHIAVFVARLYIAEKGHTDQPTETEQEHMDLLPEELKQQLPPLYSQENETDPVVICKFFHPLSPWTWYAYEGSPVDENGYYDTDKPKVDFLFFGWVDGDFPELGYFSLSELESVTVAGLGIERDLHFTPKKLSEVKQLHAEPSPPTPTLTIIILDDQVEEGDDPNGNL